MQIAIAAALTVLVFGSVGCHRRESFDAALARVDASVTLAPTVGTGLPFFTPQTLTPVWDRAQTPAIVELPDFQLRNHADQPITRALFDDHISIVGFFFSACTGFCPTLIASLQAINRAMPADVPAQIVVFSVDPEVDTPQRLAAYAAEHHLPTQKHWTLVTGHADAIYALARDTFASEVRRLDAPADLRKFAHTEHFYVIDRHRRLRAVLNGTRRDMVEQATRAVDALRDEMRPRRLFQRQRQIHGREDGGPFCGGAGGFAAGGGVEAGEVGGVLRRKIFVIERVGH